MNNYKFFLTSLLLLSVSYSQATEISLSAENEITSYCGSESKIDELDQANIAASLFLENDPEVKLKIDLISMVKNYSTEFGLKGVNYNGKIHYKLQDLIENSIGVKFKYTKTESTKCTNKAFGITFCHTVQVGDLVESRNVESLSVDILSKQNELKTIINNVNPELPITQNGTMTFITTNNGNRYVIDTSYPLQANPTAIYDKVSNTTEYLFYVNF
jgi:hypothetical protein